MRHEKAYPVGYGETGGLTKLEYAAVKIMAASCASGTAYPDITAAFAVRAAKALLAELDKEED